MSISLLLMWMNGVWILMAVPHLVPVSIALWNASMKAGRQSGYPL